VADVSREKLDRQSRRAVTGGVLRRLAAPIAAIQLFLFGLGTVRPCLAVAAPQPAEKLSAAEAAGTSGEPDTVASRRGEAGSEGDDWPHSRLRDAVPIDKDTKNAIAADVREDGIVQPIQRAQPPNQTLALPTGADKTGVSSQAISLPKGSGTIDGMGESFSAQLSTGVATFNVPFLLPKARGSVTVALGLAYSSAGGGGLAGKGWDVGVPHIARQTDRGLPSYGDASGFDINQDRFVFNGGQELVPICEVGAGLTCKRPDGSDAALPNEEMPSWSTGSMYFRPRVEGSFMRFFWLRGGRTWRVQDKSGISLELGVPLDGSSRNDALERDPESPNRVYRWHLARQYDTYGISNDATQQPIPHNVVVYQYSQDGGRAYLSDIFDTTPAAAPATTNTKRYAHHTRLVWEERSDPGESYRSGWKLETRLRLKRVDVTSKSFVEGEAGPRRLVRRYHLAYDQAYRASLLVSVQMEGRCVAVEDDAVTEDADQLLPFTQCPRLPAMRFGYSHVAASPGPAGFEAFSQEVNEVAAAPPHSIDEDTADFFDVNSDGLPDVLVTLPGLYSGGFGAFLSGNASKGVGFGSAVTMPIQGSGNDSASTLVLSNTNVNPLDLDGDGVIDLLNMAAVRRYSIYTPVGGIWVGRTVELDSTQSPKIDFGRDAKNIRTADVNFDGLVDLVVSTGQELQTFLSLGRLPGGDGRFGQGHWGTSSTSNVSNEPIRTCLPRAAQALSFANREYQFGDLNGDGLVDVVHLYHGAIKYWPGRGNGVFGTGSLECDSGTLDPLRHVDMDRSPEFAGDAAATLRIDDINGDGLDDLVRIRNTAIDVWLNISGREWAPRFTIDNTPFHSDAADRTRILDLNGSGTRDVVWATAKNYRYIDLSGGKLPQVLIRVENGLGKSTDIEYVSSTSEMLTAEATATTCDPLGAPWDSAWCSRMPVVTHMVKRIVERDNLVVAGRSGEYVTDYSYRDPVFAGQQREFRGFRKVRSRRIGDQNSPTSVSESTFLLGECADETVDAVDDCAVTERWRDNPKEALKGLPVISETYDEAGNRLGTALTTYRLRQLYRGLDGRNVRHAFAARTVNYRYDTDIGPLAARAGGTFTAAELEVAPDATFDVEGDPLANPAGLRPSGNLVVPFRHYTNATTAVLRAHSVVDFFGNRLVQVDEGCVSGGGCPINAATDDRGLVGDEAIFSYTLAGRPASEQTGWLWRHIKGYVRGSVHTERRRETTIEYNARGAATGGSAVLYDTVDVDRFNAVPGNGVAPSPNTRSTGETVPLPTHEYDEFGNVTKTSLSLANGADRCSVVGYDSLPDLNGTRLGYSQYPTVETLYVGDNCTGKSLTTAAKYDRALGRPIAAVDVATQPSQFTYDGFGRLTSIWRPDPLSLTPSPLPSVKIEYLLPADLGVTAYSIIHTSTQDGDDPSAGEYLENWSFVDGMGRARVGVQEADAEQDDGKPYIVGGVVTFDAKGAVEKKYLNEFSDVAPLSLNLERIPSSACGGQTYDAFGRSKLTFDVDGGASCHGTVTLEARYHALSKDLWDAADRTLSSPHYGTPASETQDGHGRVVATTERVRIDSSVNLRENRIQYLPSGEPTVISRVLVGKESVTPVVRWMAYDSLGRATLNVDQHTSTGFIASPASPPPVTLKTWRYVYNDAGDLVGTSDARGCGANYVYDGVGRLIAEDYSPCLGHHGAYTAPDLDGQQYMEALYSYDADTSSSPADKPSAFEYEASFDRASPFLNGHLVATYDRGAVQLITYDGRGRATRVHKRVAKPQVGDAQGQVTSSLYASRWYSKIREYDAADRETLVSTGARTAELLGSESRSEVTTSYTRRGTVDKVASSYGVLVRGVRRDADGLITEVRFGDAATTTTKQTYDARRRVSTVSSERAQPVLWSSSPPSYQPAPTPPPAEPSAFQLVLQDTELKYDVVSNPVQILDHRPPADWPVGAKPVSRDFAYDDLYRLTTSNSRYHVTDTASGSDTFISPFSAELAGISDPRRQPPAPHKRPPTRVNQQIYAYDWLGNTTSTDDDLHVAFDRSLGAVTNNSAEGKPYQFIAASQSGSASHAGSVTAGYDAAGSLLSLTVNRTTTDCVGGNCTLSYDYQWDEVGRLTRARRKEGATHVADLRYAYDSNDQRVRKTSVVSSQVRHAVYLFDTLELRGTSFTADFAIGPDIEVPSLNAHGMRLARVVLEQQADGEPRFVSANRQHVFLTLGDHLGSSSAIIDHATGELVELITYQPYGATESDYRTDRWKSFRDDYRFTGKEEDVEVGLQYFGKRYLSPYLGRWISADPLAVHTPGAADLNLYAYVSGQALKSVDPVGLDKYTEADFSKTLADAGVSLPTGAAPAQQVTAADLLNGGGPIDTPLGCFVSGNAARKAHAESASFAAPAQEAAPASRQTEFRAPGPPALDWSASAATTILAPLNNTALAINGDLQKFVWAQQIGQHATEFGLQVAAPRMGFDFTRGVVQSYAPQQETVAARPSFYMPRDEAGRGVPLAQQKLKNGTDVPLPLPEAQGRPHTVLGVRTGSDGEEYRQSATFPSGTWPKANGQDVPWGRVDWSTHGRGDHAFPHLHPFVFHPSLGWVEGPRMDKF
jgi:RHS repeat-associated protein